MTMDDFFRAEHYYNSSFHYHCLKNCLYQLLTYRGVPNAYLYIDIAASFYVTVEENLQNCIIFNDIASLEVVSSLYPFETKKQFEDPVDAEADLSKSLMENGPVIVTVDAFYLPYQLAYHKYHGSHAIFICSELSDDYQIVDWYEPHYYKGLLRKEDLRLARGSKYRSNDNPFSILTAQYQSWTICSDILQRLQPLQEKQVFQQSIWNVYSNFYKPTSSFFHRNKYFGVTGLEKWIEFLTRKFEEDVLDHAFFREFHNVVFLLYIAKRLLSYYVERFFYKNRSIEFFTCMEMLLSSYERVLFLIMKNSMTGRRENMSGIVTNMREILSLEKKIGVEIKKMAE